VLVDVVGAGQQLVEAIGADRALAIVSWVVKVFEATTNNVVAGDSPRSVSSRWAPSTFETKCNRGPSRP
jgi:hypothetical protein